MSRQAIAAVLARTDLASGERLVALSLASFAGRDNRAWPGAPAASARAGLSRSRYQQAREQLIARGLVVVDERATGRGRASTVTLAFADTGPWWDGEINVELFETVLAYSRARGPSGSCSRPSRRSRTRRERCVASRRSSCGRGRHRRSDLPPGASGLLATGSSSSSAASAAAGTQTCGAFAIRARAATGSPPRSEACVAAGGRASSRGGSVARIAELLLSNRHD